MGGSRAWESVTPFCPAGRSAPLGRLLSPKEPSESCASGKPLDFGVSFLLRTPTGGASSATDPQKDRSRTKVRPGHGLRIEFDQPVIASLLFGALSHFDLGLFRPTGEGAAESGLQLRAEDCGQMSAAPGGGGCSGDLAGRQGVDHLPKCRTIWPKCMAARHILPGRPGDLRVVRVPGRKAHRKRPKASSETWPTPRPHHGCFC